MPRTAASKPRFRLSYPALQGWVFMGLIQFQNAAIFAFYPTFLQKVHHLGAQQLFPLTAMYSVASIIGKPLCGWIAAKLGNRPTLLGYLALTIPGAVLFTMTGGMTALLAGAFVMGIVANSVFALVPDFLAQRFGSENRSFGIGFGYAIAAGGQAVASFAVPALGNGWGLATSMEVLIIAGSFAAALVVAAAPRALPGAVMETD